MRSKFDNGSHLRLLQSEQNLDHTDTTQPASSADLRRRHKAAIPGDDVDPGGGSSTDDAEAKRINDLRVKRLELMQSSACLIFGCDIQYLFYTCRRVIINIRGGHRI